MTAADKALRHAVLARLTHLDQAANREDSDALLPLARAELQRLADGWRLLLTVHQPDGDGRCRACPSGWRRRRWPCNVWMLAHRHLIGDGEAPRNRRRAAGRFVFPWTRGSATVEAGSRSGRRRAGTAAGGPPAPGVTEVTGTVVPPLPVDETSFDGETPVADRPRPASKAPHAAAPVVRKPTGKVVRPAAPGDGPASDAGQRRTVVEQQAQFNRRTPPSRP
ncbi:hypothetical protein [Actinoalloteichus hymeniacidonis]|uniref:Uncharacterized protein n=1 Tax=Actinoalloteichus hymeniacidonis TaxID=340345 RepID=A0AAC9HTX4_9PSEU|nr:hypothetical protein [Actinoalloteichus hymeniacidonis]AOS65378.1 hypothetical protein TL08_22990 [Actinoalloteichus hymeniacidonis]MBB5906536.1 hypothetical protein [Actinoalloteichus hymeniacidonis]